MLGLNIVVPLAGKDDSFVNAFGDLKPFVDINGASLIELALRCLPFRPDTLIFVCLREDEERFGVSDRLKSIFGRDIRVVFSGELTQGSACSVLLAEEYIDNNEELLVDLADICFDPLSLESDIKEKRNNVAGIIPICRGVVQGKPWGYVYFDEQNYVKELREKEINPSSQNATLGLYYFSRGSDFVKYTKRMISENRQVPYNSLFYVGPVYNLLVEDGKKIATCDTRILHALGSVDEIGRFIETKQGIS